MPISDAELGERIRQRMAAINVGEDELAAFLKFTYGPAAPDRAALSTLLAEQRRAGTLELSWIAEALGVAVEDLLGVPREPAQIVGPCVMPRETDNLPGLDVPDPTPQDVTATVAEAHAHAGRLMDGPAVETSTDCRSEEGTTVGLVDALIAIARVLRCRPFTTRAEWAALADLRDDEDARWLFTCGVLPIPVDVVFAEHAVWVRRVLPELTAGMATAKVREEAGEFADAVRVYGHRSPEAVAEASDVILSIATWAATVGPGVGKLTAAIAEKAEIVHGREYAPDGTRDRGAS
jgi:hypothetical protein